jgi:hypothetical protein
VPGRIRIGGIEKTTNRYVKAYYEGRPNPRVQPTLRRKRLRAANAHRWAPQVKNRKTGVRVELLFGQCASRWVC